MSQEGALSLQRSIYAYYAAAFCRNLEFSLPIYIFYFSNYVGLSYTHTSLIVVVLYLTQIIFDFALGVYADSFGRKKSYMLGMSILVSGLIIVVCVKDFFALLVAAIIMGVGSAFATNTLDADIHDVLVESNEEKRYVHVISTREQCAFAGRIISGIAGGLLFVIHPTLPYLAQIVVFTIAILTIYYFFAGYTFTHVTKDTHKTVAAAYAYLRDRRDIMLFCIIGALGVFTGDLLFGYYQVYFDTLHVSTTLVGSMYSIIAVFGIVGAHIGKSLVGRYSPYFLSNLLLAGAFITAGLMLFEHAYLAMVATLALAIPFGFVNANLRSFLNSHSPTQIKASISSYGSTLYAAGTMLGIALSGVLADHYTARTVLLTVIALCVVMYILSLIAEKVGKRTVTFPRAHEAAS